MTLTATAAGDSTFAGWEDVDCVEGVQDRATRTVTVTEDLTVGAVFEPLVRVSLTVRKTAEEDNGTVTSDGGGIDCGRPETGTAPETVPPPETCSATFVQGTRVTLTANAAVTAEFDRWKGVD